MTKDHIAVLKYVEEHQPIQSWTPENWNVANELVSANLILTDGRMGQPTAWGNRNFPLRNVRLDLSARGKIKEWQDAINEQRFSFKIATKLKKFSTWIILGIGLLLGGVLKEVGERLVDRIIPKETIPIQQETLPTEQQPKTQQVGR
jgi:hypothetical protein